MKTEEQTEAENNAPLPTAWENWVLSLDKYIDESRLPRIRRYALLIGLIASPVFYLCMLFVGLSHGNSLTLLVVIFFIQAVFQAFNELSWRTNRWSLRADRKLPFCCNSNNLRPFPEKGWLQSRLVEHYTCTVYESLFSGWSLGWTLATTFLVLLYWLFNFLVK